MDVRDYTVALDLTPLSVRSDDVGGHRLRGIGRYVSNLVDALVTEEPAWADRHLRPVITRADPVPSAGRPIVTRRFSWRRQDIGWWTSWLADRFAMRRHAPSLWHALDPNMPLSPLPAGKTVRTAYDLIAMHEPQLMAQIRPHRRPLYKLYARGLRTCRLVIAISEVTAHDIQATLGVPADRILVIYPAVPMPPTSEVPSPADAEPDMLFVGVPDPTKQPELAIAGLAEARRRGHDIKLRFAGYHRPSDNTRLSTLATQSGVAESVEFLGRVEDDLLNELYRTSVLIAPSRIEGFGLPPVEALLAGGKAVAGSAPVFREVLGGAADYAATQDGPGYADAYEASVSRPSNGPPADLVERVSPRTTAAALVAAYEQALDLPRGA